MRVRLSPRAPRLYMKDIFNESDLKSLFSQTSASAEPDIAVEIEKPVSKPANEKVLIPTKFSLPVLVKFLALFIGIFFLSYSLINATALVTKFRYFFDVSIKRTNYSAAAEIPTPNPFNPSSQALLVIPKIGIEAPIIWNVDEASLNERLLEGVVHSQGTALPGQVGNIFITGHSSYYSWIRSDYKDVFVLLDKLEVGDQIFISYSSTVFNYEVTNKKIVSPSETSVMDQGNDYNLTLMTCVPVGTNLNRLIIRTHQIKS